MEPVSSSHPNPSPKSSDGSLLRLFQKGDPNAAQQLFLRYARRLQSLAKARCSRELSRRLDPEDIVQSVFDRFFRRAQTGDYKLLPGEELWKLLLVIALNNIRGEEARHRASKRDVRLTCEWNDEADSTEDPHSSLEVLEQSVQDSLEQLVPRHRNIVQLRLDGFDMLDIAQKTGQSLRTVERILQEVRNKLRNESNIY